MIARGISESVMIAGRISQSSCRSRLSLPLWCSAGGLPCLPPAYPAFGLLSCPLSPQPPSPVGKGETISLFRRGLRPRHPCIRPFATLTVPAVQVPSGVAQEGRSPADLALPAPAGGLAPGGIGSTCRCGARRGACFLCRLPTLPLVYFPAPYPPDPLPRRGRGRIKVFLCKGLRPLHPRG